MLNEKDRYKESAIAVTGCKVQTIFKSHHYVRTSERLTATKNIGVFFELQILYLLTNKLTAIKKFQ